MKKLMLILILSLFFLFVFKGQLLASQPKSVGHPLHGCSSCHVPHGAKGAKLWPFKFELQTKEGKKLSQINALCYSCHDGTITNKGKDFFENDKSTHPVGVKPPETMQIPDRFPLDFKGRITCATCHNPHNSNVKNYLRISNENGQLCIECHINNEKE